MEDNIFDKVHEVDLKKTMETSYINYAMSVIASRALPDVRDGLKPVQRRILYSMIELNNGPDPRRQFYLRSPGQSGTGLVYEISACGWTRKLWISGWRRRGGDAIHRGASEQNINGDDSGY